MATSKTPAYILLPVTFLATTITTGNSFVNTSSHVTVNNGQVNSTIESNVESSGGSQSSVKVENNVTSSNSSTTKIYKRIEVNSNGEKKVVESTEPVTISVQMGTVKGTSTAATPTVIPSPTLTASPSATPTVVKPIDPNTLQKSIKQMVEDFLKKLFGSIFK